MDDLVSRNKVLEAMRSGTTHDDIRARIEIMESVPAIPISVIEQIKAEIKELIDWHDCPMELDNGNDAWYCEACNMAISIIDKHIKEYTE